MSAKDVLELAKILQASFGNIEKMWEANANRYVDAVSDLTYRFPDTPTF